jgi:hypothetical protein
MMMPEPLKSVAAQPMRNSHGERWPLNSSSKAIDSIRRTGKSNVFPNGQPFLASMTTAKPMLHMLPLRNNAKPSDCVRRAVAKRSLQQHRNLGIMYARQ